MEKKYRSTRTNVFLTNYHFVFCPRYRRKIFLIEGLEERFKQLVLEKCEALEIKVQAMECDKDHVHLFLSCLPTQSPSEIMHFIKGYTEIFARGIFKVKYDEKSVDA